MDEKEIFNVSPQEPLTPEQVKQLHLRLFHWLQKSISDETFLQDMRHYGLPLLKTLTLAMEDEADG